MYAGFYESEGKRPFGRPRCKFEDNINIDLKEIAWEMVEWIYFACRNKFWALVMW
jgi:hypothetical protein